jgi:predicted RNase H-like HicB family nuclease
MRAQCRCTASAFRHFALASHWTRPLPAAQPHRYTAEDSGALRALGAVARYTLSMRNEFTAIIERDGKWFVAYCPEVPGANGQGRTKAAARKNLASAITLILQDRRTDALRGLPRGATRETVTIE